MHVLLATSEETAPALAESVSRALGNQCVVDVLTPATDRRIRAELNHRLRPDARDPEQFQQEELAQAALELAYVALGLKFDFVCALDALAWNALADVVPVGTPLKLMVSGQDRLLREIEHLPSMQADYRRQCLMNSLANADQITVDDEPTRQLVESLVARSPIVVWHEEDTNASLLARTHEGTTAGHRQRIREYRAITNQVALGLAGELGLPLKQSVAMLRVLIASLNGGLIGGVQTHIRTLAAALRRKGHIAEVITPSGLAADGATYLSASRRADSMLAPLRPADVSDQYFDELSLDLQVQVARALGEGAHWDVVHCHESVTAARMLACFSDTALVCTVHSSLVADEIAARHVAAGSEGESYLRGLERKAYDNADAVIVESEHLRDQLAAEQPGLRAHVVPQCRQDPDAARRLAAAARQRMLEGGDCDIWVDRILELYRQGIGRHKPTLVMPYRSLKVHASQVVCLLEQGRQTEAIAVNKQRRLSAPEQDYLERCLDIWRMVLAEAGEKAWLDKLESYLTGAGIQISTGNGGTDRDLRYEEYRSWVRRASGTRQGLIPRDRPVHGLHITYVMNHVNVSGGAKVILEHANNLRRQGVETTIVCHYPKPDWFPVECQYIQVPFSVDLAQGIPPCDVIVATYWEHASACVETGIAPVVYFEQGDFHLFDDNVDQAVMTAAKRMIGTPARIMCVSRSTAKAMEARFGRESYVTRNAVDAAMFHASADGKSGAGRPYMMMMGSDRNEFKRTDDVLKAYELIQARGIGLDLVWVSPTQLAKPAGRVYVQPSQAALGGLYRGASVFVSGSRYESFSLPPLEAMASGCPVVSAANTGVLEYAVDGENCLIAGIGDAEGLAEQISRVLSDDALRARLVANGLATAARFRWDEIVGELRQYYSELAAFRPEPRNSLESWEIRVPADRFVSQQAFQQLCGFLEQTEATAVEVPVIYDLFDQHQVARWELAAVRRGEPGERPVRCYAPARGTVPRLPYASAYGQFTNGRYDKALAEFVRVFNAAKTPHDKAVYVRWIALCLLELQRDKDALDVLSDARDGYPDYTDITYLYGLLGGLNGRRDLATEAAQRMRLLGESAAYPEFFWGMNSLADRL